MFGFCPSHFHQNLTVNMKNERSIFEQKFQNFAPLLVCVIERDHIFQNQISNFFSTMFIKKTKEMIIFGHSGCTFFVLTIDREELILSEQAQNFAPLIVCVFERDDIFQNQISKFSWPIFIKKNEKMIIFAPNDRTFFALKIDMEGSTLAEISQHFAQLIVCVFERDNIFQNQNLIFSSPIFIKKTKKKSTRTCTKWHFRTSCQD